MSRPAAAAASRGSFCGVTLTISPRSAMPATAVRPTTAIAPSLGGCDFAADPRLDWRSANVFWRPEVAADVVSFVSSPANFSDGHTVYDLRRLAAVERLAADGLHMLWGDGTQLWIVGPFDQSQPLCGLLAFDSGGPRRALAATNVWRQLRGTRPIPPKPLSPQAIDRYRFRLRALDGRRAGASTREIGTALFGPVGGQKSAAWKSSDLRSRTMRLVADGQTLAKGGYVSLLR